MRVPTRSDGMRSGVNWTRLKVPPSVSARVLIVRVLARPGTPSRRRWPPDRRPTSTRSSIWSWPTMTRRISKRIASAVARGSPGSGSARRSALEAAAAVGAGAAVGCGIGVGVEDVGESDMSVSGEVGLGLTVRRRATSARAVAPTLAEISEGLLRGPRRPDNESKPDPEGLDRDLVVDRAEPLADGLHDRGPDRRRGIHQVVEGLVLE